MANVSSVSSEEELLQLRNEGKITEDEYEDLRETLRKTTKPNTLPVLQDKVVPLRTSGLAIASLACSLLGPVCCIPAIICGHLALRRMGREPPLRGYGLAIAGLIIGYIILGISIAVTVPFLLFLGAKVRSAQHISVVNELRSFPLDDMEGLITQTDVQIDKQISSDGNGSLRIEATKPVTIRLFQTDDIDIENARLIYQAKVKTENVEGQVFLEMLCHFPGKGDFFSRGLMTPLSGSTDWTTQETPFFLRSGENPDNIKLNLVIDGKGTVWIDDIRLLQGPLK
jgi:hypothetical protein